MFGEPNFTLTQLRYFVAVSEAGGITEAAKNLLVSQSAVSVAITNWKNSWAFSFSSAAMPRE